MAPFSDWIRSGRARGDVHVATRERILALARASPGLPATEIMKRLGLVGSTIHYHLERMEAAGLVRTMRAGRRRLVYAADETPAAPDAQALSLLRGRTACRIARAILDNPGGSIVDLVETLDESPRAVYYHLKQLREAGLIRSDAERRYRGLTACDGLDALLRRIGQEGHAPRAEDAERDARQAPD